MDPLTRIVVSLMCVLTASLGIANAKPAPVSASGITTVTLRSTVRLAADTPLTLGSIASIEGAQAATLSGMPIDTHTARAGSWTEIPVESVRTLIDTSPAHAGSIVVVGQSVSVTRVAPRTEASISARVAEPDPDVVTVRDHLGSWLRSRFRASPESIRVAYPERAAELLTTPTDGRTVSITEIGFSGKIALRVEIYESDYLVTSDSVRVDVQLLREALVLTRPVRRGSPLRESDVRREQAWIDPTDPPAPVESAIGQSLVRSLQPGQIVREHHVEAATMIERGQDVSVRTVQGTVVVTTVARARHDARRGELVELETKDGSRRRFTARVAGPGRAVMTDATEQSDDPIELSETPGTTPDRATTNEPRSTVSISDAPAGDIPEMKPLRRDTVEMKPIRNSRR